MNGKHLTASFNASADAHAAGTLPAILLARKYDAMLKYKASEEDKPALAEAMFDAIERSIKTIASPDGRIETEGFSFTGFVRPLLESLAAPESAPYVPPRAPAALADLAIALTDRVGTVTSDTFKRSNINLFWLPGYKQEAVALGEMLVEYADKLREAALEKKPAIKPVPAQRFSQ